MPQELPGALHPATERRSAIWPWLLMPLAALTLFLTLERLRHGPQPSAAAPAGAAATDSSTDDP